MIRVMTTQPNSKPRLGILMCGHSPDRIVEAFGRYDTVFSALLGPDEFTYQPYFVVDNNFPESINDADAWLLTGSKHGAYEPHDWIKPLESLIQQIYAAGQPMVGICFGHQIMAQALGGTVVKHDGGWIVGTQHYAFEPEVGQENMILNAWHQDQVVSLPPDASVVGASDTCAYAALSYRTNTVSIQPHPEFENDYLSMLLAERGKTALPKQDFERAASSLGQNLTNRVIARWLRDALKSAVA